MGLIKAFMEILKISLEIWFLIKTGQFHEPNGEPHSLKQYQQECKKKYKRVKQGSIIRYINVEI